MQFHVARALEFFVDQVVHPAAGLYQRCRQDRDAAAFFDVSGGAEELFRFMQSSGIESAGQGLARCRHDQVVGSG